MIKIEHPEIDVIAQEYFDLISPIIIKRAQIFTLILEHAFGKRDNIDKLLKEDWRRLKSYIKILFKTEAHLADHISLEQRGEELKSSLICKNLNEEIYLKALKLCKRLSTKDTLKVIILSDISDKKEEKCLIERAKSIKRKCCPQKRCVSIINKIIDYDILEERVNQNTTTTIAYWLTRRLNINTCPYCNRMPIHTVIDNNNQGLIRPTLDHFYPKSKEPLLALSFYNLIPSCYYCNSSLKGSTDIDMETHLHPYLDGFGDDAVFSVDYAKLLPQKSHPDNYNIKLTPSNSISQEKRIQIFGNDNPSKDKDGNKNLFKLEEIYQVHQDVVGELVVKAEEFKAKQENIRQFYSALATNDSELYQFYFGNYLNPNDHNKRPLAKLTRDIVLEILPEISFSI